MAKAVKVVATWDDEAGVWVAESGDIPGLVAEADSPASLIEKLKVLIPELLDLNGYADGDEIPFRIRFSDIETVSNRHAA